jgi:ParB-like chromosome segregation protein Spo0J
LDANAIPQIEATGRESRVAPSTLRTFHKNPRRGDVPLVMESLQQNGQYRPLIVNVGTHTGRPNEVLAGNHLLAAAMKLHLSEVAVHWVDVDEERARRIVLVDNAASDRGKYDADELTDLLGSMDDLAGTGYSDDDLARLLEPEPERKVEFAVKPKAIVVTIECSDESEQVRTLKALEGLGYTVRAGR